MHAERPFPPSILQKIGANPDRPGTFFASATSAQCDYLAQVWTDPTAVDRLDMPTETPPVSASFGLEAFGPLGSAIENAVQGIIENGMREIARAVDGDVEKMVARVVSALPPVGTKERADIALATLPDDETQPANLRTLAQFCAPGRALKPVKFAGEPGASKTWAARRFASLFGDGCVFDVSCHAGTTQRETLGAYVPFEGGFTKVYGKISRAFRNAQNGQPTLLIMDEINRLPVELQSVFCGALNKQTRHGFDCYILDTGLPTHDGATEEFAAPCHLLSVVATQNEGSGYNVSSEDRAEKQRWIHVRVSYNEKECQKIIETLLNERFSDVGMTLSLSEFLESARELSLVHKRLETPPTIRCIVDAISIAQSPDKIGSVLWALCSGWYCGLNRTTNQVEPEHIKALQAAFDAAGLTH